MSRLTKAWRKTRLYRWWISGRLPNLLIIGGQKCGTSALFSYLRQHPAFLPSEEKEIDFFQSNRRYACGLRWYADRWPRTAVNGLIRFEASPAYLVSEHAAPRIRECIPAVKLIAILRDPVDRAYSAWRMYRRQMAEDPGFYERLWAERYGVNHDKPTPRTARELNDFWFAIERELHMLRRGEAMEMSIVQLGLYGPQLKRYVDLFPKSQLLVLDSDDLRHSRVATLNRVLQFLNLPDWDWSLADLGDVFVGNCTTEIPLGARDFLLEYYRESNCMLAEMLDEPPAFAREAFSSSPNCLPRSGGAG